MMQINLMGQPRPCLSSPVAVFPTRDELAAALCLIAFIALGLVVIASKIVR